MIKKFLKIIIICLILIIVLIFIFKSKSKISFDDTLFLKLFQSSQEKSNDNSKQNATKDYYEFNVDSKTEKIQLVDLYSTTDNLTLEELSNNLKGTLQKNELKIIKIKWCWEYESQGQQDTKDSKIEKYEFEIHVEGEEKR